MSSEVDEADQSAGGEVVELPAKDDSVTTPPAPSSSSSTSRIPRLTSSLRRHLPVLAGLRHDRDRKPACTAATTAATPATTVTIGTVQPATPPSSKVSQGQIVSSLSVGTSSMPTTVSLRCQPDVFDLSNFNVGRMQKERCAAHWCG